MTSDERLEATLSGSRALLQLFLFIHDHSISRHEMRWWHQAHFGLWQRPELLQRSDGWYVEMLPNATVYATNQGYKGARWPKMVGPETTLRCNPHSGGAFNAPSVGQTDYSNSTFPLLYHTGPSGTGPMLIWQQPHIIWMSEQQVRTRLKTLVAATLAEWLFQTSVR